MKKKDGLVSNKNKVSFGGWVKKHQKGLFILSIFVVFILTAVDVVMVLEKWGTRTEIVYEERPVHFRTEYIDDDNLELGIEEIEQVGIDGVKDVHIERKKKLLTGNIISFKVMDGDVTKEPTAEIIRRGTRRWQYMHCSDYSYYYYTDEQLQNPKVGYTHASEDSCATNGHGAMIALADIPPTSQANLYPSQDDSYWAEEYLRFRRELDELNNSYADSLGSTEPFETSINYDPFAEYEAKQEAKRQKREAIQQTCKAEAESAKKYVESQLGAMGVAGPQLVTAPQEMYSSTYNSCLSRNNYSSYF